MMIRKCLNCYWGQRISVEPKHFGCYAEGKWRKWISKKKVDIPIDCQSWKRKGG